MLRNPNHVHALIFPTEHSSLPRHGADSLDGQICPGNTASGSGGTTPIPILPSTGMSLASSGAMACQNEGIVSRNPMIVITLVVVVLSGKLALRAEAAWLVLSRS